MLQLVRALPYSHSEGKCVVLLSCDVVIFTYFLALKWQLASNSVVFMTRPSVVSFLMEDLLVPYVHYIPLQDDFSDLEDMVRWAKKNDKKARWIANQATKYMENLWMSEKAKKSNNEIAAKLGIMYHAQFNRALKLCT
mmetsp:Transcript_1053/g.2459  ORF Transcript_1053/g.2459 Transcript_1053/m.2459 type:complete len:138 (+) Transcript_1053:57-470(+)